MVGLSQYCQVLVFLGERERRRMTGGEREREDIDQVLCASNSKFT